MKEISPIWLFSFTAYSYCQGTRDSYKDMKLLTFTVPCFEYEAVGYLQDYLAANNIEFKADSIETLNINIINS